MDWFEKLFGFQEQGYEQTRQQFEVLDGRLHSRANGKSYGVGELELVSLKTLRERVHAGQGPAGRLKVGIVRGDVRAMHSAPEHAGALFQVASQFNLLEMVSPEVTPEHGVTRYQYDGTQGPACAMAAGAATVYRNYFVAIDGEAGQTRDRQLNGLADLGLALSSQLGLPLETLWTMRNGYAMCTRAGLEAISAHLSRLNPEQTDGLRGMLRIGVHSQVEVTDHHGEQTNCVSQAYCSALPVAYAGEHVPVQHWAAFATLILEAAYEATLSAAVLNTQRTGSNIVLLTRLGGGVFGNDEAWIDAAMRRAFGLFENADLDVRLVSYGAPTASMLRIVEDFR
jgi:hypothetical protein